MARIVLEVPDQLSSAFMQIFKSMKDVKVVEEPVRSEEEVLDVIEAGLREAIAMSKGELPKRSIQSFLDEL